MMRQTDEADRGLLAEVERVLNGAPPAAVHELLALRRRGAERAELERFIARRLASPIALRLAAGRWLNAVSGAPNGSPDSAPVPASFGRGGGPRRVQPIERR